MAEVDHAMLASSACVEADGSLTVVGGHRTVFEVVGVPGQHVLCVAGRLLVARREPPPTLGLAALTPRGEVPDVASWTVEVPRERTVEGRLPVSFAATLVAPAPSAGAYALVLSVNGDVVRTLPFAVLDARPVDTPDAREAPEARATPIVAVAATLTGRRAPG